MSGLKRKYAPRLFQEGELPGPDAGGAGYLQSLHRENAWRAFALLFSQGSTAAIRHLRHENPLRYPAAPRLANSYPAVSGNRDAGDLRHYRARPIPRPHRGRIRQTQYRRYPAIRIPALSGNEDGGGIRQEHIRYYPAKAFGWRAGHSPVAWSENKPRPSGFVNPA